MVDLDGLGKLVAQMAPGPWVEIEGHPYLFCNARGPKPWNHDIVGRFDYASADADRKAIAALRNAAGELIRDARRWREHCYTESQTSRSPNP